MSETTEAPSPEDIKAARNAAGHTQTEAGKVVHVALRTWQQWEGGRSAMPAGLWELYRIKTGKAART